MTATRTSGSQASSTAAVALRVLAAAGLGISAYVHLHLASHYSSFGKTITMGQLFYVQGVIAALLALALLITGKRYLWWAAALLGAGSFAAVMTYRYVNVGTIGPLPNMYDPSWLPSPDKALSAVVEAAIPVLWLIDEARRRSRR